MMQNYQNVVPNVFVCQTSQILGVFFGFVCEKNLKGWSDRLETWHAETLDPVLKKARKQQFYPGSPSL